MKLGGQFLSAILLLNCGPAAVASTAEIVALEPTPAAIEFFEQKIRPLFVEHCYECHSANSQTLKGGLRLDSRDGWFDGGQRGRAIVPGDVENSLLIKAVRYVDADLQMPPKDKKLSPAQIRDLADWVKMGAPDPRRQSAALPSNKSGRGQEDSHKFWAYQPLRTPRLPDVKNKHWVKNPIDVFIAAQLETSGLAPMAEADRRTLIRRATFDLTGLPPSPREIEYFLKDPSPNAFEIQIDRLLASTAYGERWGRHWLDVARYADTAGDGADYPVREAGKYRDWVIQAFNADQPYDQFVREQIAGDILARMGPTDQYASRVIATGFLAIGKRYGYSPAPDFQHLDLADVIDSVGRSLLGQSLGCARCHDHKYDPISATDYYALYGIFQSTKWAFPGGEELKRPAQFPALVPPEMVVHCDQVRVVELARLDSQMVGLKLERAALDRNSFAGGVDLVFEAHPLGSGVKKDAFTTGQREPVSPQVPRLSARERLTKIGAQIAALAKLREAEVLKERYEVAYGVSEGTPVNARIQKRGEPNNVGDEVPRRFLAILGGDPLPAETSGSGRLELAHWLTRRTNPLTARVFVNRVWQWHFGQGLVSTTSDFGTRGEPPSHPELLDWLASQFIASGWSVKSLHRLIMKSRTYQLASDDEPIHLRIDPENRRHWRYTRQALNAESIRDSMLAVGGRLDRSSPPQHPFPLVGTWGFTIHQPFHAVYHSNHRSVYLMVQRNRRHPFLALFDAADPNISVAGRQSTITPTQTLYLMNSSFVHDQSEAFANRLIQAPGDEAARVRLACELAQGRAPEEDEVSALLGFLADYQLKLATQGFPPNRRTTAAWAALARVLLTSNAFLYVD